VRLERAIPGIPLPSRAWTAVGAVGFAGSVVAVWLTTPAQVGAIVLAPWVALLAFELGIGGGVGVSILALLAYLGRGLVAPAGDRLTWLLVGTRLLPLLATGVGAAWVGSRLRSSEHAYRSLVEGLPLGMYIASTDRREFAYLSPQIEEITGHSAAELQASTPWSSIVHAEDRAEVELRLAGSNAEDGALSLAYRVIRPDGTIVWVRDVSVAVGGRTRGYRRGFVYDISPQLEAQEARRRDAQLMQALVDGAIDAMCLTDREGRVLLENVPMRRAVVELRIPRHGLIHERLLAIADRFTEPEDYRTTIEQLAITPDEPSLHEFEFRDSGRFFQGFTSPVIADDGTFLGRIWTLREVTEARQLERQQRTFVATVSHELRTPLTSILGYIDLLYEALPADSDAERFLTIIARNAARLRALVDDLLFVAQVDAGHFDLNVADVDLAELAAASHEAALPAAQARGVELGLSIEARPTLVGDPARLAQAIDNIVSNAIKFTPEHGTVDIRVGMSDGTALLTVADTGIGIPLAEQGQIGERFFRSSTATEAAVGGTGLGMTIVKMIVGAHEGNVRLESEPGRGTTVTLELPREGA